MDGQQNPQTVDNSAPVIGADTGASPTGENLSLAQAMGYDIDGAKPTEANEPATDTSTASEGSAPDKSEPKLPTWFDQLSEETKGDEKIIKTLSKFNKVEDLAKSYTELQKLMGSRIELPKDDASEEALTAFWTKLGKPKDKDGYSIKAEEDTGNFRDIAFASNLTDSQAKSVFEAIRKVGQETIEAQKAALKARYEDVDRNLRTEFGNQYEQKKAMLNKGLKAWGNENVAQVLINTGAMFNEDVAKLFIRLGEAAMESNNTNKAGNGSLDNYKSRREGGGFSVKL